MYVRRLVGTLHAAVTSASSYSSFLFETESCALIFLFSRDFNVCNVVLYMYLYIY